MRKAGTIPRYAKRKVTACSPNANDDGGPKVMDDTRSIARATTPINEA